MLEVYKIRKSFSGFTAVDSVSLAVPARGITAVIGPNGAGKSTLFNLLTGHLRADSGSVALEGRDITTSAPHAICRMGVGRSFQHTNIFRKLTVFENVQAALIAHGGQARNFWGPAIGAAMLTVLNQEINAHTVYWPFILGSILIVLLFVFPGGIVGAIATARERLRNRRHA